MTQLYEQKRQSPSEIVANQGPPREEAKSKATELLAKRHEKETKEMKCTRKKAQKDQWHAVVDGLCSQQTKRHK